MDIPRQAIEETKAFIKENESIKHIHYRELYKNIDITNYQICTKVDFKECVIEMKETMRQGFDGINRKFDDHERWLREQAGRGR